MDDCQTVYEWEEWQFVLNSEHFVCPELLFRPGLQNLQFDGVHRLIFDSITRCDADIQKDLYGNIVLAGGSTMFQGFPERVEKEIIALAPATMKVKVVALPERKYLTWIGGSILASLETFSQMVITREEYNEAGLGIVHRKFF
jgi:actin